MRAACQSHKKQSPRSTESKSEAAKPENHTSREHSDLATLLNRRVMRSFLSHRPFCYCSHCRTSPPEAVQHALPVIWCTFAVMHGIHRLALLVRIAALSKPAQQQSGTLNSRLHEGTGVTSRQGMQRCVNAGLTRPDVRAGKPTSIAPGKPATASMMAKPSGRHGYDAAMKSASCAGVRARCMTRPFSSVVARRSSLMLACAAIRRSQTCRDCYWVDRLRGCR